MRSAKHLLVVLSNAVEGSDDVFNKWYSNRHLGDIVSIDGFSAAQRFKLSERQIAGAPESPYTYLAIYEVDVDDLDAAANAMMAKAMAPDGMYVDPSLDQARTVSWFFTPLTEKIAAP
jgi:hypothetical protein